MSTLRFWALGTATALFQLQLPRSDAAAQTCPATHRENAVGDRSPATGQALMQQQWQLQVPGRDDRHTAAKVSSKQLLESHVAMDLLADALPWPPQDVSMLAAAEQRGLFQHASNATTDLSLSDAGVEDLVWWQRLLLAIGTVVLLTSFIIVCAAAPKPEPLKEPAKEVKAIEDQVQALSAEKKTLAAEVAALNSKIDAAIESGKPAPPVLSNQDLLKKADELAKIGDEGIALHYREALQTVAPVVVKAQKVKKRVEDNIQKAKEGAGKLVVDKASSLADIVLAKLEIDFKASDLKNRVMEQDVKLDTALALQKDAGLMADGILGATDVEVPSAPMLLAGLLAPIRLQILITWNRIALFMGMPMLLVLAGVTVFDLGQPCERGYIWVWASGMLCILGLALIARLWTLHSAVRVLQECKHDDIHEQWHSADTWIVNMKKRFIEDSTDFFKGLVGYDHTVNSIACRSLSLLNALYILWGGTGIFFSIWYVVQDTKYCKAGALMFLMHFYSFIYVMLLSFTLPVLLIEIVAAIIDNTSIVETVALSVAKGIDKQNPQNFPVATLFARAFFLSSVSKIHEAEAKSLQVDVDELTAKKTELQKKASDLQSQLESKEARFHKMLKEKQAAEPEVTKTAEEIQAEAKEYAQAALQKAQDMGLDISHIIARAHEEMASQAAQAEKQAAVMAEKSRGLSKAAQIQAQQALEQAKDRSLRLAAQAKESAAVIKKERSGKCRQS
mmetsp:Transcript_41170/g.73964  ORF Transcript_41170/g.73964 Transcript_41170/m.73964 type:complete len:733 (-) Transcript_41170:176-2374(-)